MSAHIFYRGLGRRGQEREKRSGKYVKGRGLPSHGAVQGTRKQRSVTQEMGVVN